MTQEMRREYEEVNFIAEMRNEFERRLGSLKAASGARTIILPLDTVDINAKCAGRVVEVTVSQIFKNPYNEHLEAEYIFPLAGCVAVNSFKMHVAGRTVIGTIQERRAARAEYQQALAEGKRASLLEQERDDVFTLQVGNIPPGERITVELTYIEKLQFFEDGTTELRLPLVVAPRYVPGTAVAREQVGDGVLEDTDQVPDASRISPPRLADGVNPDLSLSLSVELTTGLLPGRDGQNSQVSDLCCSQHAVKTNTRDGVILVNLAKANELLNRDFVLKWRLVREKVTSSVVLYDKCGEHAKTGYGMLSIVPPALAGVGKTARDVVFVLDRSGSMFGEKMASAAKACAILLSTLGPRDRFAINAFDDVCQWYGDKEERGNGTPAGSISSRRFFNADEVGIENGIKYLKDIEPRGGTELAQALQESLTLTSCIFDKKGRVPIIVVLTDGQVGNESHIYQLVQRTGGDTRIFTVGIDTAVNDAMLSRLAKLAGGTSTFVMPGTQLEDALINVGREIGAPIITDIKLESLTSGVTIDAVAPARLPDLFEGRTSDCMFRIEYENASSEVEASPRFRMTGTIHDGSEFSEEISANLIDLEAVSRLWAKEYIKELEDAFRVAPQRHEELKQEIINLSLTFSVLTKFTAFVAVDNEEVVNQSGQVRQVIQPVHMPDQWKMQQQTGSFYNSAPAFGAPQQALSGGGGIHPSFFQDTTGGASAGWGSPQAQAFFDVPASSPAVPPPPSSPLSSSWASAPGSWGTSNVDYGAMNWSAPPAGEPHVQDTFDTLSSEQEVETRSWNLWDSERSDDETEPVNLSGWFQQQFSESSQDEEQNSDANSISPRKARPKQDINKNSLSLPGLNTPGAAPGNISSIWSTMKKLVRSANPEPPAGSPPVRILTALKQFKGMWNRAWDELDAGRVPDWQQIEKARKELIDALSDHPVGFEVPRLQRFLRTSAKEFVAALQASDVSADAVNKMRPKLNQSYEAALNDMAQAAMSKLQGRQGTFWESTV